MTEYKQAVKNVKTVELREEIRRHCEILHQKSTKNTDLIHFFEIYA
ncbi:hypothetical protein FGIG_11977 [Fasciola gigantica]|uniref:Uncharacterized protein n=1 Tax=Fasciola gigantica TaxID=46835 RepID=A0A504Y3L6_FASGI|nr:hypothetical protein FGIG_11977 [Fasciola gigantica]